MASNHIDDQKPNLRPTKRSTASGKSLYLHHNPNQLSDQSYIRATWNDNNSEQNEFPVDREDPFGIQQPNIPYSLNKHQRWEILNDFREHLGGPSTSSPSDDDLRTQSDSERRGKQKKSLRKIVSKPQTKYRLYEHHNIAHKISCVGITTNVGQQRTHTPRKTYMQELKDTKRKVEQNRQGTDADTEDNEDRTSRNTVDVTYVTVVPPPRDKYLANIRKNHGSRNEKSSSYTQHNKSAQIKDHLADTEQLEGEKENLSTDEDESMYYTSLRPARLQLNDFIPVTSVDDDDDKKKRSSKTNDSNTTDKYPLKSVHIYPDDSHSSNQNTIRFHRQISKEEKLYNRDMNTYLKMQPKSGEIIKPKDKSSHCLMSLSFRTIFLHRTDFTVEHLSKVYGKNFIHAQCSPMKYLICLTDRLKSVQWLDKFNLFSVYTTLNCYLVISLNHDLNNQEMICQGQVALNMDLNRETIEIENLSQSNESIYKIDELIDRTIEFITSLSFDTFKPIDSEINQRKYFKNETDNELSESEFLNKQIRHVHTLDKKDVQSQLTTEDHNNDVSIDDYNLVRPEICTTCYSDMTELTPMTALKSCAHWLCDQCWKQYLENAVKHVTIILCPEWNCSSIVDIGTILSLANVRCMNMYERNIEKCLVNLSRSYVKCPSKSCSNIVQVIGSSIDNVRCRCGHQFCIECKQEPHFPATCSSYQAYIDEARRNGDLSSNYDVKMIVEGRKCVSCDHFIEKNGGCNHMTCRCGAQFCWLCTAYWKDHFSSNGEFLCPRPQRAIQKKIIFTDRNSARRLYEYAIYHRRERAYSNQVKQNENCKRLIGTIPLDKLRHFDSSLIKAQIDKREALLRHAYEMVKYINYLHRVCEFVAVAADGYADNPVEFSNSLFPLETLLFNLNQILEGGRGYQAVEQLTGLHQASEKLIERLRRAVAHRQVRRTNTAGYMTS